MNRESTYWAFSAAAQAVGTFAALLLAAYALVHSMMESLAQQDDSLLEIHRALKRKYYSVLAGLAATTALAVLLSLLVVYANSHPFRGQRTLAATAASLVVLSVAGGVFFVLLVVDPRKYERAARHMAASLKGSHAAGAVPSTEFFELFVALERRVRELYERHISRAAIAEYRARPPSIREMLDTLAFAGVLPPDLQEAIKELNRRRNLIFHGHVTNVDPKVVEALRTIVHELARTP